MTCGGFSLPPSSSAYSKGGRDFRGYAAFAMQRRVVDASHVEDDGAERLN